jgi:hypothetical protein
MDMQDKDFDKIFNSRFEDFEAEPSPKVWKNIADKLEGKKDKRSWWLYLNIAAGIVVVFTVGLLFMQKQTKPEQHHNYANLLHRDAAKSAEETPTTPIVQSASVIADRTSTGKVSSNNNNRHTILSTINKKAVPVVNKVNYIVKDEQPEKTNQLSVIQTVAPATIPIKVKPITPDAQLTPKTIDVLASTPAERPVVIASAEEQEAGPEKKHGIHNLGGLINALIAKVDRRQDKLIEFSDSDDDDAESNLTGVNLGLIKIKKQ